ncbi:DoxX family protein [Micrococcales bacterium 31B]|nr:DoxX family protein [Micrococcales bacterium 31B]
MHATAHPALLIARVVVGVLLIVHGVQKITGGLTGFFGYVESLGVPAPSFFGSLIVAGEFGLGLALILGVFTRLAGALLAVMFLSIALVAQWTEGLAAETGIAGELDVTYILLGLVFLGTGAGKFGIDKVLAKRAGALARLA